MTKVLILQGENTYNYGAFMLLINFVYYTHKKDSNLSYYITLNSEDDLFRLKSELPSEIKINRFEFNKSIKSKNLIDKIIGVKNKLLNHINQIKNEKFDKIVFLGGDGLSEYYKKWTIITDLLIIRKLSKFTNVYLIGQTIGPFYSWRKNCAKRCFQNCYITLRDSKNKEYLINELKISNFIVSSDLAFLELPNEENKKYVLSKYKIKKKYITIIPSGSWKQYCKYKELYLENWKLLINNLLNLQNIHDCKIVLFPHVCKPLSESDLNIINVISDYIKSDRIIYIKDHLLASEAREIIKNGFFTITGRMHPSISSFSTNVPAIPISYSIKYDGIIKKDLDFEELLVDKDKNIWINNMLSESVIEKINYLLLNKVQIDEKIRKNIHNIKKQAILQIEYFNNN